MEAAPQNFGAYKFPQANRSIASSDSPYQVMAISTSRDRLDLICITRGQRVFEQSKTPPTVTYLRVAPELAALNRLEWLQDSNVF